MASPAFEANLSCVHAEEMEIPSPPEAGWDVWAAAMAFLGHKFRQAHKNQIKRTFSLHAVMDGEESLQCEFDGRSESSAGIACSSRTSAFATFLLS